MAKCIECGEYTKFNGGLCDKCYRKGKNGGSDFAVVEIKDKSIDNTWVYNVI